MKKIVSKIRKAIEDYNMIEANDKIAVGVSGGKDSLTLACALNEIQKYYPKHFEIEAITVDMGFTEIGYTEKDYSGIAEFFKGKGINYTIVNTSIAHVLFEARKEKNPCSLCSKMRKGALHEAAKNLGCNKVALGHHHDDVIETLFLSLFYEARISCFSPVTYLDRTDLYLIRPMIYVEEKNIRAEVVKSELPVFQNPCRFDGYTKRQDMKNLLNDLSKENKNLKNHIFGAIQRSYIPNWNIGE